MALNYLPTDKSVPIFVLSTVSTYYLLKGLKRWVGNDKKRGVIKLAIYPIKSVPGIEVDHLEVTLTGVKYGGFHDRTFMLLNEHGNLISLRTKPSLTLISTSLEGDDIVLNAPSMPTLRISNTANVSANTLFTIDLWEQEVKGVEYSAVASAWFTLFLKAKTVLVKFLPESMEYRKTDWHTEEALVQEAKFPIQYQDECAVALTNQVSIDELNGRLAAEDQVSYLNFRSNVVVRDGEAFSEDKWNRFQIGAEAKFLLSKPCHKCNTTLAVPELGVKNPRFEPLETLRKYRINEKWVHLYTNQPIFGLSLAPTQLGTVRLGDQVTLLDDAQ